mgnify:CR=1 FL=1
MEKKREPFVFVMMTYLFSLICWGVLIITGWPARESAPALALYMLGGLSPTLVALLLPLTRPRGERKAYYRRYFRFRIPVRWYLIPIAATLLIVFVPYAVALLFFREAVASLTIQPLYMVVPMFFGMILGGGLEELGWRGILVHDTRDKNPFLIAGVIGILWACWHIPLFFVHGVFQYQLHFIPFLIGVVSFSFMTTALYLRTKSVVPCIIFHAAVNAFGEIGFYYPNDQYAVSIVDAVIRLAVAVVIFAVLLNKKGRTEDALLQRTA